MESSILKQASRFLREQQKNKRWHKVVAGLAVIVAAGTVASLAMPGQARTHQVKVLDCPYEAHSHTEECYVKRTLADGSEEDVLVCGQVDYVLHVHNDDCYDANTGELVCELPEITADHVHTDECYEEEKVLVCGLEEGQLVAGERPEEGLQDAAGQPESANEGQPVTEGQPESADGAQPEAGNQAETQGTEQGAPAGEADGGDALVSGGDAAAQQGSAQTDGGEPQPDGTEMGESKTTETGEGEPQTDGTEMGESQTAGTGEGESQPDGTEAGESRSEGTGEGEPQSDGTETGEPQSENDALVEEEVLVPHVHTEECYRTVRRLVCEELEPHVHTQECYGKLEEQEYYECLTEEEIELLLARNERNVPGEDIVLEEGEILLCELPELKTHVHNSKDGCFRIVEMTEEEIEALVKGSDESAETEGTEEVTDEDVDDANVSGGDTFEKEASEEDVSGGDASGGDVSGGDVSGGDIQKVYQDDEVKVVAFYGPEAEIPEEAELRVEKVEVVVMEEDVSAGDAPSETVLSDDTASEGIAGKAVTSEEPAGEDAAMDSPSMEGPSIEEPASVSEEGSEGEAVEPEASDEEAQEPAGVPILSYDEVTGEPIINEELLNEMVPDGILPNGMTVDEAIQNGVKVSRVHKKTTRVRYHIGFFLDGEEVEPAEGSVVTVQITFLTDMFNNADTANVIHHAEDGQEDLTDPDGLKKNEDGHAVVTFQTTSFSDIDVIFGESGIMLLDGSGELEVFSEDVLKRLVNIDAVGKTVTIKLLNNIELTDSIVQDEKGINHQNLYVHGAGTNITLDLNGHILSNKGYTIVDIWEGATFTLIDTRYEGLQDQTTTTLPLEYGKRATYEPNSGKLTYYVTESQPIGGGKTQESLVEHVVNLGTKGYLNCTANGHSAIYLADGCTLNIGNGGAIMNGSAPAIRYGGGTINLGEGSFICGNHTDGTGAAIRQNDGSSVTINMEGGIIAGNTSKGNGGAIAGVVNMTMTRGVIAGNATEAEGGAMRLGGGSDLTVSGSAVISGNSALRYGGGIWADSNTTISLSGLAAYVTNNYTKESLPSSYNYNGWDNQGGGGIFTYSALEMSGGYVTGNQAVGGGGIFVKGGTLTLTGGKVAANNGTGSEGGGIRLGRNGGGAKGTIIAGESAKIYITNNKTETERDWGGGGIFVAENCSLKMQQVVFAYNSAGGFGGGVAGCSTGLIVDNGDGRIAVFSNSASGTKMAGDTSSKHDDRDALNNPNFVKDQNYQDLFCAYSSTVYGNMLGGGYENWIGTCDNALVEIKGNESATSSTMMGLTARPTGTAEAMAAAKVFVTGNSSTTHGGGIMCNGILTYGDDIPELYPGVRIKGTKSYLVNKKERKLLGGEFTFLLLKEEPKWADGKPTWGEEDIIISNVNAQSTNGSSEADFDLSLGAEEIYKLIYGEKFNPGSEEHYFKDGASQKTVTVYLVEEYKEDDNIKYDSTVYKIELTVKKSQQTVNGQSMWVYRVTAVEVEYKTSESGEVQKLNVVLEYSDTYSHSPQFTLKKKDGAATFTNEGSDKLRFRIKKVDGSIESSEDNSLSGVQSGVGFKAYDGKTQEPITDNSGDVTDGSGYWYFDVEDDTSYYIEETVPREGYEAAGPWCVEVTKEGDKTTAKIYEASKGSDGKFTKGKELEPSLELKDGTYTFDYTVENYPKQYELPETGGSGTTLYTMAGMALLALAGLMYKLKFGERRSRSSWI